LSAIERPVANLIYAIESVGEIGQPYVITCGELLDFGLLDEVEVMGWVTYQVSKDLEAVVERLGCYCSGPYLGHPDVGADDYYLVERKKAA
jgi:hypothetical protein